MRKFSTTAFITAAFLFTINFTNAQYITIADTNFVSWLNSHGYSGCLVGNQMDTTCVLLNNPTSIYVGPNITDLTGIKYFRNLSYLSCQYNELTFLPSLPDNLLGLQCDHNYLTSLPPLPIGLEGLNCGYNQLTSLPLIPSGVRVLDCGSNLLTSIPPLPDTLDRLYINSNPLTCMPLVKRVNVYFYWLYTDITCLPYTIDVDPNRVFPSLSLLPICPLININSCTAYSNIAGTTFTDSNSNCVYDSSEITLRKVKINLFKNGLLQQQTYSSSTGAYSFFTDTGNYVVSVGTMDAQLNLICPSANSYTVNISSLQQFYVENDFSLECNPSFFDVGVSGVFRKYGIFRPGNQAAVGIHCGDMSNIHDLNCSSATSGTITVIISGPAEYISSKPGAVVPVVNGNVLTYNVSDFGTFDFYNSVSFIVETDTFARLGQQLCFTVIVQPTSGDANPNNNNYTQCFPIVSSYDPNFKEVSPSEATDTSKYWLTYTIHFQNTGNAPAQHIYIMDTLDSDLDESSLELLAFSHEPVLQVNGSIMRFNFANINLPDSVNNEPGSHGFVQYKVKRKDNLPIGTQIQNIAYIYFDFNSAVVTNTTFNELTATGIHDLKKDNTAFSISPNPLLNGNLLTIRSNSTSERNLQLVIYDLNGRIVFSSSLIQLKKIQSLSLPWLESGIYQCTITTDAEQFSQKLVIVN